MMTKKDKFILWISRKLFKLSERISDLEYYLVNPIFEKFAIENSKEKLEELMDHIPPGFYRAEIRGCIRRLEKENLKID